MGLQSWLQPSVPLNIQGPRSFLRNQMPLIQQSRALGIMCPTMIQTIYQRKVRADDDVSLEFRHGVIDQRRN